MSRCRFGSVVCSGLLLCWGGWWLDWWLLFCLVFV